VFSNPDINNRFFYSKTSQNDPRITLVKNIFSLFPSFPVSICFGALIKRGAAHLDQAIFAWVDGQKVTWADFSLDIEGRLADGLEFTMPSPMKSMKVLLWDIVIFLVLTWYFDHIISHNRGVAE
jgi:hypothetical protein